MGIQGFVEKSGRGIGIGNNEYYSAKSSRYHDFGGAEGRL